VGERNYNYVFENTALALLPPRQRLNLANIFAQDTISILPSLKLTLGLKLEDEPYAGAQLMPSVRLAWKPVNSLLLWAAVSRAVRSPTPVDTNLHEFNGPIDTLDGSRGFRPETMIAYELGTRIEISSRASLSVSLFYDDYDKLRSINRSSTASGLPLVFGNLMTGNIYGIEAWGNLQVTDWWRLTAGVAARSEHFQFLPGAFRGLGLAFVADDPPQQATVQSSMNFGHGITVWADLREVGRLPHPSVSGYTEADARISWDITKSVQLSLAGYNLLHRQHTEFIEPGQSVQIPRSFFAQTRVRF
jgi:iron complex outermembrane recepter protein